jgi:hypothetical protein
VLTFARFSTLQRRGSGDCFAEGWGLESLRQGLIPTTRNEFFEAILKRGLREPRLIASFQGEFMILAYRQRRATAACCDCSIQCQSHAVQSCSTIHTD